MLVALATLLDPGEATAAPPPPAPPATPAAPSLPDTSPEGLAAQARLAAKRAEAARLAAQIDEQGTRLDTLSERYNAARQAADAADARAAAAERALAAAVQEEAAARDRLRGDVVRAYVDGGSGVAVSTVLEPPGHREMASKRTYTEAVLDRVKGHADELTRARSERDRAAHAARTARAEAHAAQETAKADADAAAEALRTQRATLGQVQGELAALVAAEESRLAAQARQRYQAALAGLPFGPLPLPNTPRAAAAVAAATRELGKPYLWGGTGPDAFDCSGLMLVAYRAAGVSIPRVAEDQRRFSIPIPASALAPGDLVFFGLPAHHVGMYVGNDTMVEAPHTGAVVRYGSIWRNDVSFGRVP